jgi:hypothetical protein
MSLPGPIIVVSNDKQPKLTAALDDANLFPIVESNWTDASRAVAQMQPAAVLVAMSEVSEAELLFLARQVGTSQPYLPLIGVDPGSSLPKMSSLFHVPADVRIGWPRVCVQRCASARCMQPSCAGSKIRR